MYDAGENSGEAAADATPATTRTAGVGPPGVSSRAGMAMGAAEGALLDAVLQLSPDAAVIIDGDGLIRAINSLTTDMFGYPAEQLAGQPIEVLLPPRLRDVHAAHRAHYLADPKPRPMGVGYELLGLRNDGTQFPVDISLAPITSNGLHLVVAAIRDITVQQRVERDAARLAAIVRASDAAILSTTVDRHIDSWNHAAERLFGYPSEEALGHDVAFLVPDEQREELTRVYTQAAKGHRVPLFDTKRRRKDGTELTVAITVSGIRDQRGQLVGYCEVVRDQTDRLQAQESLARAAAERDVFAERERIARELHETVIHRIFGAGLSLGGLASTLQNAADRDRLNQAIAELDMTVHDIRTGIFTTNQLPNP